LSRLQRKRESYGRFWPVSFFFGEDVYKRVGDLSGGEKGRLALAKLIYSKANVLVLDEPTNHLDIPSREALEEALKVFEGTIIAVSHDRYFLDRIATQIFAFEHDSQVELYNGNYTEYHDWKESQRDKAISVETGPVAVEPPPPIEPAGQAPTLSKNEIRKLKDRISEIEVLIPKAEEEFKIISQEISSPDIVADQASFNSATDQYNQLEKQIQDLFEEWDMILAKLAS
jgi:ATP-binding cassette subfamily F protein 3